MPSHPVTDELLKVTIGIKLDAGVDRTEIDKLIDSFSARRQTKEGREEFLAALSELTPERGRAATGAAVLSATEIWQPRNSEDRNAHRTGGFLDSTPEKSTGVRHSAITSGRDELRRAGTVHSSLGSRLPEAEACSDDGARPLRWIDLDSLTTEINFLRSHYHAAKESGDFGRARALTVELEAAIVARGRLISRLGINIAAG
jgi:hypothetical protein